MPGFTRRKYAGGAVATTISGTITSASTSLTLTAYTGWPHGSDPFYVVIDPGTASEEKLLVTRTGSTDTTLNVASGGRGVDGTAAVSHSSGATIYPVFTATDADEANTVASTLTTKGDVLVHTGSAHARQGVGANNTVLVADSAQTNGVKWSDDLTLGSLVVSENASTDAVRITQTGAGNALVVEDETNPDSTPFVVTGAGRVGIGMTTPGVALQVQNTTQAAGYFDTLSNNSAISLRRNNGTFASPTTVASGENIGTYGFLGHDGTSYRDVARVLGVVDAAVSTGVVPGRLIFSTTNASGTLTERMRIDSSGQVGIGATPAAGRTLVAGKNITGSTTSRGITSIGQIQSDVTSIASYFATFASTNASAFTVATLQHYLAEQGTIGATSAVTDQIGFFASPNLTGATNNYGFWGGLSAVTGRWNLYMAGTAANYLAGRLGVGATLTSGAMAQITNTTAADKALIVKGAASQSGNLFEVQNSASTALVIVDSSGQTAVGAIQSATCLNISKSITGNTNAQAIRVASAVASDVTGEARYMTMVPSVDASVAMTNLVGARFYGATLGSGASITSQVAFWVDSTVTAATNNYGFYSAIAAASGRWNFYAAGTARNYFAGGLEVVSGTTGMTSGFTHIPAAAGVPTGTPTNPSGNVPMYYDTTNNKLYVYNGAWKSVALA